MAIGSPGTSTVAQETIQSISRRINAGVAVVQRVWEDGWIQKNFVGLLRKMFMGGDPGWNSHDI